MTNRIRNAAQKIAAAMPPEQVAAHRLAWLGVAEAIKVAAPKGAKVFEVHHTIETARAAYLAELAKRKPIVECERAARARVGV